MKKSIIALLLSFAVAPAMASDVAPVETVEVQAPVIKIDAKDYGTSMGINAVCYESFKLAELSLYQSKVTLRGEVMGAMFTDAYDEKEQKAAIKAMEKVIDDLGDESRNQRLSFCMTTIWMQ